MEKEPQFNPVEIKEFNKIEAEIKVTLSEIDKALDEGVQHLLTEEGNLREMLEINQTAEGKELEQFPQSSIEASEARIKSINEIIELLKTEQEKFRSQLERYYKVDEGLNSQIGSER